MSKPRKAHCDHPLRSSAAVNYLKDGKICLLPLELMECLDCGDKFILNALRHAVSPLPMSKSVLKRFMEEADKEAARTIIIPGEVKTPGVIV